MNGALVVPSPRQLTLSSLFIRAVVRKPHADHSAYGADSRDRQDQCQGHR